MQYMFVYETTNNINGKKYIGQHKTNNIQDGYLGSGVLLTKAINKYGINNFTREILAYATNKDDLNEKEKYYIAKFNAIESDMYYNIAQGGEGGNVIAGYTEEQMKEYRKKLSEALKGREFTRETKAKISENSGSKRPEVRKKISENNGMVKPVIMIDKHTLSPIACFDSGADAREYLGKPRNYTASICRCCKGNQKTAYGYKWKYIVIQTL